MEAAEHATRPWSTRCTVHSREQLLTTATRLTPADRGPRDFAPIVVRSGADHSTLVSNPVTRRTLRFFGEEDLSTTRGIALRQEWQQLVEPGKSLLFFMTDTFKEFVGRWEQFARVSQDHVGELMRGEAGPGFVRSPSRQGTLWQHRHLATVGTGGSVPQVSMARSTRGRGARRISCGLLSPAAPIRCAACRLSPGPSSSRSISRSRDKSASPPRRPCGSFDRRDTAAALAAFRRHPVASSGHETDRT